MYSFGIESSTNDPNPVVLASLARLSANVPHYVTSNRGPPNRPEERRRRIADRVQIAKALDMQARACGKRGWRQRRLESSAPTSSPSYEGAFRTPTLRCVSKWPSFMHTGTLHSLVEVVAFFARGGDSAGYPGSSVLAPVQLAPDEVADLVAFLRSLDGLEASLQ
jgi:hypothetical protein